MYEFEVTRGLHKKTGASRSPGSGADARLLSRFRAASIGFDPVIAVSQSPSDRGGFYFNTL
jgi:hypothetical protein